MTKAEELLKKSFEYLELQQDSTSYVDGGFKGIKEHLEDIKNYLNRKEKLVVGSVWVCEVDCIGSKMSYSPYDDGTVFIVDDRDFVTLKYFIYDNAHEDDMPLEQFLACFSPVEKENV